MLNVEKPEHNFILFYFPFKNTFVAAVGLPRQIVSDHLIILKQKLFTYRFEQFSLRYRSLLFNIPKFMFSLFIKKCLVRYCCLIKLLISFRFFSNLLFIIIKLEIYTIVFSLLPISPSWRYRLRFFLNYHHFSGYQFRGEVLGYQEKYPKTDFKMVLHSICCCSRNTSYGDSRFLPFIQSPTFYMFYSRITKYERFFSLEE